MTHNLPWTARRRIPSEPFGTKGTRRCSEPCTGKGDDTAGSSRRLTCRHPRLAAYVAPPLSTARISFAEAGARVAEMSGKRIARKKTATALPRSSELAVGAVTEAGAAWSLTAVPTREFGTYHPPGGAVLSRTTKSVASSTRCLSVPP